MPGLPSDYEEIVTSASTVKPATIMKIQAAIIGDKKASKPKTFFPAFINSPANWTAPAGIGAHWLSNAAAVAALISVPMEAGDRVTGLSFSANGDGVVDCVYTVWAMSVAQAGTQLATLADNNRPLGWGVASVAPFTPWTFSAGESLLIQVAPNAGGYRLGNGQLFYDRL